MSEKLQVEQKSSLSPRVREPLFWLAWFLFLLCMFLPQGGTGDRYVGVVIVPGLGLELLAVGFLPLLLLNPSTIFSPLTSLALAVSLSALLFIASPFILQRSWSASKKMHTAWLIYSWLNLICTILFLVAILTIPIVGHIDPQNVDNQLLPGFLLWVGAQIILTIAAATKL